MAASKPMALKYEHAELGARFGTFGEAEVVLDYGIEVDEPLPLDHPLVCDLSFQGSIRVVGADAARFLQTLTTGDIDALDHVGACCHALALTAEAEVIDLVYVLRTGDYEFMLVVDAPVVSELVEWLGQACALKDDDGPVFPDVSVEDETGRLACLCLMGAGAQGVLLEFATRDETPALEKALSEGLYFGTAIGGQPMMVACDPEVEGSFLVYASRNIAIALWRALMGFEELQAVGFDQYVSIRRAHGLWLEGVDEGRYRTPAEAGLAHLLRPGGGYVGAGAR